MEGVLLIRRVFQVVVSISIHLAPVLFFVLTILSGLVKGLSVLGSVSRGIILVTRLVCHAV